MNYYIIIVAVILLLYIVAAKMQKSFSVKDIVVIGLLVAISSSGRVALSMIPSVQPSSFIIIVTGMVLGGGAGYIVGTLTAFISNIFLGMGPWLPWQMLMWGIMGLTAPLLKNKGRLLPAIVGVLWGFVFGWVLNLYWFLDGTMPFSWIAYLASCGTSFVFDLMHGVTNGVLLLAFSEKWLTHILAFVPERSKIHHLS